MTIIQILPMRLFSALGSRDERPATYLGRAGKYGSDDLEDEKLEPGPFAHDFGVAPAWVHAVDDDAAWFGGRGGEVGEFAGGEEAEEFGDVVST